MRDVIITDMQEKIGRLEAEIVRLHNLLGEIMGIATEAWGDDETPDITNASTKIFGVLEMWQPTSDTRRGYQQYDGNHIPYPCWSIEGRYINDCGWQEPQFASLEDAKIAAMNLATKEDHDVQVYRWENEYRRLDEGEYKVFPNRVIWR